MVSPGVTISWLPPLLARLAGRLMDTSPSRSTPPESESESEFDPDTNCALLCGCGVGLGARMVMGIVVSQSLTGLGSCDGGASGELKLLLQVKPPGLNPLPKTQLNNRLTFIERSGVLADC